MRALLYDIHGNLPALEAVLEDAERAGATSYLLGGDYALFGAWPVETLDRLEGLDAVWLRGNGERWTAKPAGAPDREPLVGALRECRRLLSPARVASLAALPFDFSHDGRGGGTLFCHASPRSDVIGFEPEPADDEADQLAGVAERRVVAGHTHIQFRRQSAVAGVELVNPGSVGLPLDGDTRAAYALQDPDGGIELRRVEYDVGHSALTVRARFGPWAETVARRLEQAALVLAPPAARAPSATSPAIRALSATPPAARATPATQPAARAPSPAATT
jgi:diadenosine tetraphosphatase ApaH/serine/threonine PP2A family protein phosphatase